MLHAAVYIHKKLSSVCLYMLLLNVLLLCCMSLVKILYNVTAGTLSAVMCIYSVTFSVDNNISIRINTIHTVCTHL